MFAAAQTSEHDDITCDGSLVAWAEQRGNEDAVKPLTETREVEKRTDKLLSEMAEQKINRQAAE